MPAPTSAPPLIDPIPNLAGLRTLGIGSSQAAAGDDARFGRIFAGVGDCKTFSTGSINASSNTLNCPHATFVTGDVGKSMVILGAGAAGATLSTTITARLSSTSVTVAASASTTVSSGKFWYGTDDSALLLTALNQFPAEGGKLKIASCRGGGSYLLSGSHNAPAGVTLDFDTDAVFSIPAAGWTFPGGVVAGDYQILDIGSTVVSDRALTSHPSPSPAWWGAAGDHRQTQDGVTTNSSADVTSATAAFTSADIGKTLSAYQVHSATPDFGIVRVDSNLTSSAGTGAARGVIGRIIQVNSSTSVTLDANANFSITGAYLEVGTPNQLPFRRALNAADSARGGVVRVSPGTYALIQDNFYSHAGVLELPNRVHMVGSSWATCTIKIWQGQDSFTRIIVSAGPSTDSDVDSSIRDLTFHGNQPAQLNPNEQQHLVFVRDGTHRFLLSRCRMLQARGDCFYVGVFVDGALTPKDVTVDSCFFEGTNRDSIHAQSFRDLVVADSHFSGGNGQYYIKEEPDGPGQLGNNATITGCTFEVSPEDRAAGAVGSGVLFAGSGIEDVNRSKNITVTGCIFRGLDIGVQAGVYVDDFVISNNIFDECAVPFIETTFNVNNGFNGYNRISICNNVISNCHPGTNGYAISLASSTDSVIQGNTISGPACTGGINTIFCKNMQIRDNTVDLNPGVAGQIGIRVTRCQNTVLDGNYVNNSDTVNNQLSPFYFDDLYTAGSPPTDQPLIDTVLTPNNYVFGKFQNAVASSITSVSSVRNTINTPHVDGATISSTLNVFDFTSSPPAATGGPQAFGFARVPTYTRPGLNVNNAVAWVVQVPSADTHQRPWPTNAVAWNLAITSGSDPLGWWTNNAGSTWTPIPQGGAGGSITAVTGVPPIASSGGTTPAISLNNSGVTASTYTNPSITVNAKGLITAAASGSGGVTSVGATAPINSSGGTTPNITINDSGVTPSSYTNANITVNSKGLITSASNGSGGGGGVTHTVPFEYASGNFGLVSAAPIGTNTADSTTFLGAGLTTAWPSMAPTSSVLIKVFVMQAAYILGNALVDMFVNGVGALVPALSIPPGTTGVVSSGTRSVSLNGTTDSWALSVRNSGTAASGPLYMTGIAELS